MEDLCRVCMQKSDLLTDIFAPTKSTPSKSEAAANQEASVASILNELAGCELVVHCKNGLTQYICLNCIKRAREALDFKRLVEQNNQRFLLLQGTSTICKSKLILKQDEDDLMAICDMLDPEDFELVDYDEDTQEKKCIVAICSMLDPEDLQLDQLDNCNIKEEDKSIVTQIDPQRNKSSTIDSKKAKIRNKDLPGKGSAEFRCPQCKTTLSNKGNLRNHMRIHTGERPFQCPQCPRTFVQKQGLTVHIRTHTGERPYRCASCPEAFAQMSGLVAHNRRRPWHHIMGSKNMKQCKREHK